MKSKQLKCPNCGETKNIFHDYDIYEDIIRARCLTCYPTRTNLYGAQNYYGPKKTSLDIFWDGGSGKISGDWKKQID